LAERIADVKRRSFIRGIGKASVFVYGGALVCSQLKTLRGSNAPKYIHRFECQSKLHPDTKYSNADQFWTDHIDWFAKNLNKMFLSSGLVVSLDSQLNADQKSIMVTKIYKNEESYKLFHKIWRGFSENGRPDEFNSINYISSKHHVLT